MKNTYIEWGGGHIQRETHIKKTYIQKNKYDGGYIQKKYIKNDINGRKNIKNNIYREEYTEINKYKMGKNTHGKKYIYKKTY